MSPAFSSSVERSDDSKYVLDSWSKSTYKRSEIVLLGTTGAVTQWHWSLADMDKQSYYLQL